MAGSGEIRFAKFAAAIWKVSSGQLVKTESPGLRMGPGDFRTGTRNNGKIMEIEFWKVPDWSERKLLANNGFRPECERAMFANNGNFLIRARSGIAGFRWRLLAANMEIMEINFLKCP
ncbi:hypothetical protein ETAA8_62050 [Anatilimnocola aggregata]|uniref:Uncharacterized protein n=1 Tax=Anatilimnocola aggregata TaxID=2528021 RepID=A0A517YLE6_9BACT|nr:hypothetical protein ETAA8_62050 [Anatilimnocola aggregata]